MASVGDNWFDQQFAEHQQVLQDTRKKYKDVFQPLVEDCYAALIGGGKLIFFGNGGSAADAQHLATELTVRYKVNRRAIAALALTTDTSALTAIGNDFGFDQLFSRQIEALGKPGDVAIGISTSGRSPNVVRAIKLARDMQLRTVAFTGEGGGDLAEIADILVAIPSKTTARIQEMHLLLGHLLCEQIEARFVDTTRGPA